MDAGEVVEEGSVYNLFANPSHEFTRQLVSRTLNLELPARLLETAAGKILKLLYRGERAEEPIISETIRLFGVQVNILHGQIEYIGGQPLGALIVALEGAYEAVDKATAYIVSKTAGVEVLQ